MVKRNLTRGLASLAVMVVAASACASAEDAPAADMAAEDAPATELLMLDPAPRFGRWLMDSEAPAPAINVMTYEAWGDGGMQITVASTNARGEDNEWGYATMFDGEFLAVEGQEGSATAVEFVDEQTTRISNMRNGRVTQVIINTLSEDGETIENEYVRLDAAGKITSVGHATYRRMH